MLASFTIWAAVEYRAFLCPEARHRSVGNTKRTNQRTAVRRTAPQAALPSANPGAGADGTAASIGTIGPFRILPSGLMQRWSEALYPPSMGIKTLRRHQTVRGRIHRS